MNSTELQKATAGYSVGTVGDLATFEGKAFVKETMGTTSVEVSFGSLAPRARSFMEACRPMIEWATENLADIMADRARRERGA